MSTLIVGAAPPRKLYPILFDYARDLYPDYDNISSERKYYLDAMADFIKNRKLEGKESEILFIGSNQSTRSIMTRVWATVAAHYYGFDDVALYSGGLQEGPISTETIQALERAGFIVYKIEEQGQLYYQVKYTYNVDPIIVFPKKIKDKSNPVNEFMSVIVCPNAAQNISVVKGSYNRLELTYEDPLGYEGTGNEEKKYDEICRKIAVEMFYVFSQLKNI